MEMALRASATASPSLSSTPKISSSLLSKPTRKAQFKPTSLSLPTATTISLFALPSPHEAKAFTLSKDQIVSSITRVEETIDQVQRVGSTFQATSQRVFQVVTDALKPGIDVGVPFLRQAGEQALKLVSPAVSEVSKKAQEAIERSGLDPEPVRSAAKTVADAAQQTTKLVEQAKPIASSTVEAISSADPIVLVGSAGALFLAYLLFPPIWSAISYSLRGYKGELTPAQTIDLVSSNNLLMIDIRSEKDKDRAGIPRLPSSAKNRVIAIPRHEVHYWFQLYACQRSYILEKL